MSEARHLSAATQANRVVVGQFEKGVAVWELDPLRQVSAFQTLLDFGGDRLAISNDGEIVVAAAYQRYGAAAYRAADGDLIWNRRDLKRSQHVTVSHRRNVAYVCADDRPCDIVSLDTGETERQLRGVRQVFESTLEAYVFIDQNRPVVATLDDFRPILAVERTTFAILSVAFDRGAFAMAEAGGPVRCFSLYDSRPRWTFRPADGVHCLSLAYSTDLGAFVGVFWPYKRGGNKRLVAFDAVGEIAWAKDIGDPAATCFCMNNSALLTSTGILIDLVSGIKHRMGIFSANKDSG